MSTPNDEESPFSLMHEHYLKRELLRLEVEDEVLRMGDFKNVGALGSPFTNSNNYEGTFPILGYMLRNCVVTFPFVSDVDEKEFWGCRVQQFLEEFARKDISSSVDRTEETKRRKIGERIKKMVLLYTASGLQTTRNEKNAKIENVADRGIQDVSKSIVTQSLSTEFINGYNVNVCGVRFASTRRGFLYEQTAEFIVRTEMGDLKDSPVVHVARKYSEFKELDKKLRKEFPGKTLPRLPSKNKTSTAVSSFFASEDADDAEDYYEDDDDEKSETRSISERISDKFYKTPKPPMLKRERQRTTLRGYLRELLRIPQVARNQTFLEFLFRDRLHKLSKDEIYDIQQRKKLDLIRLEHQLKFFEIATERARKLEGYISEFKAEVVQRDGLRRMFMEIKEKNSISELSPKFQKFIEWAVIEFSATLYHMFVAEDSSPEFYSQIKRIHGLMPYTILKGILRYSNPVAMMKGMTDLFLAQPFGKRSLLQNIFWIVLNDDIKAQERLLVEMRKKFNYPDIIAVIHAYCTSPTDARAQVREYAAHSDVDIACALFDCGELMGVRVAPATRELVRKWHAAWNHAVDHGGEEDNDAVDNFSALKEYFRLEVRKRDKDKIQEFWGDDVTVKLIKELVTVFYAPLIKVFKSANVHESVGDFEAFMSDLIKVVDKSEHNVASSDPNQLVETFIALCTKHQESVFKFIHQVYHNDDGLFTELMNWISGLIEFLRQGNGTAIDLFGIYVEAQESESVDTQEIIKEMDAIIQWVKDRREWRDKKLQEKSSTPASQQDWSEAMPAGAIEGNDFGLDNEDLAEFQDEMEEQDDLEVFDTSVQGREQILFENLSPVEQERRKRELMKKIASQTKAPKRPVVHETKKLLPLFHKELCKALM